MNKTPKNIPTLLCNNCDNRQSFSTPRISRSQAIFADAMELRQDVAFGG